MSTRSPRLAALAGVLVVSLVAGCGSEDDERVSAEAPDFTVELPDGWEEQDSDTREQVGETGIDILSEGEDIPEDAEFAIDVQAVWTVGEPSADFRTNVNVFTEQLGDLTPERYMRFTEQQLRSTSFVTDVGPTTDGPTVDGEPSKEIEYSASQDVDVSLRVLSVFHDGGVYNITLSALPEEFDEASADLDEILSSWSWN